MADLEQHLHAIPPALAMNPLTQALRSLLEAVALARNSRDGIAALGLLQKVCSIILKNCLKMSHVHFLGQMILVKEWNRTSSQYPIFLYIAGCGRSSGCH